MIAMSELSFCCPQCGSIKSWHFCEGDYNGPFDRFDKANPDIGCCWKCGFHYSEHINHSLKQQIEEFRAKRKAKKIVAEMEKREEK